MTRPRAEVIGGGMVGVALWTMVGAPTIPAPLRFAGACGLLLAGAGAVAAWPLLRRVDPLARLVLPFAIGVAALPALHHVVRTLGLETAFPYAVAAAAGAYLVACLHRNPSTAGRSPVGTLLGLALVAGVALGLGVAAFAPAMAVTDAGIVIRGDYDAFDLSYYAALAGELTHTVPPRSPFNAGGGFTHAYYPHVIAALVHRASGVPLLDLYFRFLWPAFLLVLALTAFVFVRTVSSPWAAGVSVTLLLVGSDLSWIAVWLLDPATRTFDDVIWSSNFQSPSAETLLFNNWTPALVLVFFAAYALARDEDDPWPGWPVAAAIAIALLLKFKPFASAALLGGLLVSALLSWRDAAVRRRCLVTAGAALVAAAPLVVQIARGAGDAQARIVVGAWLLPQVTLEKIGLTSGIREWAAGLGLTGAAGGWLLTVAGLAIFLVGGLGFRLAAVPAVWRALRRRVPVARPIWQVLAGAVVVAMAVPSVLRSEPYHETLQFHQMALFLLPVFLGHALAVRTPGWRRSVVVVALAAIALPSTVHYLLPKWREPEAFAQITTDELAVAAHLATLDPERTVVLHRDPGAASLLNVMSARRSVLAWARYVPGSLQRRRDVSRFFAARDQTAQDGLDTLHRYGVTHVVERVRVDRIHPGVRRHLRRVMRAGDAVLYEVPGPAADRLR